MKNFLKKFAPFILATFLFATVVTAQQAIFPQLGGTGTSTAPTNGQVLVGQPDGTYGPQATSTLGLGGGGSGTVTSVAQSVPTGLAISGSPITTSGTLALSYASGYAGVLTASTTNWNNFFDTPSSQITAGTEISWSGNTLNVTAHTVDTTLSQEQVEDFTGAMVTGNTESLISVVYQDVDGTLDFTVTPTLSSFTDDLTHTTDTSANTICTGTGTYLDGDGGCDALTTNQSHTGDVTGSGALAIASNIIIESDLLVNAPTNDYVLTASSTASGGFAWAAVAGSGTVTSVAQTVPTGFTITGSPITGAGTLAIAFDTGYSSAGLLTASTTNWNGFYDTPSGRITAGNAITWSTNTLNFDGGASPAGELGGTWASPTIDDSLAVTSWNLTTPTLTSFFGTACTGNDFLQDISDTGAFTCVTATGGGGGGVWSTSTDNNAQIGETILYTTDDVYIGGSASNTAEFNFDVETAKLTIASSTVGSSTILSTVGDIILGDDDGEQVSFNFVSAANEILVKSYTAVATWVFDMGVTLTTGKNFIIGTTQWNSGDSIDGGAIAANTILEPALSADNAPSDTDYLQYDSTGTNFLWRSVANVLSDIGGQAQGAVLDDLNTTGANAANSEFLVGTGAGALAWESGATARTSLGVDAAGTDNSTDVTVSGTPNYITLVAQDLVRGLIDLAADITGTLPVANGGTGITSLASGMATWWGTSSSANFLSALSDTLNLGGESAFEIPNGTNPTVNTDGEIAEDTTQNQLIFGANANVLLQQIPRTLGFIGSTSVSAIGLTSFDTGTSTWSLGSINATSTIPWFRGYTDTGTCLIVIGEGNATSGIFSLTTAELASSTIGNVTFNPDDKPVLEIGSCASTPNYVAATVGWAEVRQ